jgi:hypothetical protein
MKCHAQLFCWDGISLTFCLDWPQTSIFLIFASSPQEWVLKFLSDINHSYSSLLNLLDILLGPVYLGWTKNFGGNSDFYFILCLIFFLYCCFGWAVHWHLQRFLQYINYFIPEFSPSVAFLYPPQLIQGIVTTGIIIAIICMCTYFLQCIHTPKPLSPIPLPSHCVGLVLPSFSPILQKWKDKRKTWHLCLFAIKVAIQGISL